MHLLALLNHLLAYCLQKLDNHSTKSLKYYLTWFDSHLSSKEHSKKLDLEVEFYLRDEFDTDQYIDQIIDEQAINTYGKRYIFSDISNDTKGMTFEADMIHSPTLSFQFFMRPELGHYQYRGLKEFNNPGGYDFIYYEENQIREIDENA